MELNRTKGYIFAFLSTLAMSNVYIFSKAALKEISLAQFGFYWFGTALILFAFFLLIRREFHILFNLDNKSYWVLFWVGLLEIAGTSLFFLSIKSVDNPTIVSFLGNLKPIFVIFLGLIILGESFSRPESFGIAISIVGAIILGYQEELSFQALLDNGVLFIFSSMLFGALSMVIVRKNSVKIPSTVYAISRSVFLMLSSVIFMLITGDSLIISSSAAINVLIGAALGPFAAIMSFYYAIKYVEAARVSLIGTSKGIFVLLASYFVFDVLPGNIQLIGGFTTIFGVAIMILGKNFSKSKAPIK